MCLIESRKPFTASLTQQLRSSLSARSRLSAPTWSKEQSTAVVSLVEQAPSTRCGHVCQRCGIRRFALLKHVRVGRRMECPVERWQEHAPKLTSDKHQCLGPEPSYSLRSYQPMCNIHGQARPSTQQRATTAQACKSPRECCPWPAHRLLHGPFHSSPNADAIRAYDFLYVPAHFSRPSAPKPTTETTVFSRLGPPQERPRLRFDESSPTDGLLQELAQAIRVIPTWNSSRVCIWSSSTSYYLSLLRGRPSPAPVMSSMGIPDSHPFSPTLLALQTTPIWVVRPTSTRLSRRRMVFHS